MHSVASKKKQFTVLSKGETIERIVAVLSTHFVDTLNIFTVVLNFKVQRITACTETKPFNVYIDLWWHSSIRFASIIFVYLNDIHKSFSFFIPDSLTCQNFPSHHNKYFRTEQDSRYLLRNHCLNHSFFPKQFSCVEGRIQLICYWFYFKIQFKHFATEYFKL